MDAHLAALGLSGDDPAPRRGRAAKAGRPRRGAATGARRGRPPRDGLSLVDRLHQVLAGKEMGVSEAGQAVLDSGYKTASKNFRTVINQTLLSNKDRFRKVSRGIYTAK